MQDETIRARLEADISAYAKSLDEARKKLAELNKSHDDAAKSAENLSKKADQAEQSTRRHGDTAADVSRRVNDLRQALNGSTDAVIDLAAAAFRSGGVMGALGTTVAALGVAAAQGYFETQKLNREIILSGSIAGQTTGQMLDLARSVGAMTGSQSQAIEVLTRLAGESAMSAEALKRITTTAIELEQVGGAAVEKTVDAFVKLAEDPIDASIRLNEQYNYLTQAVFDQIRALEEQGQKDAAAEMAQNALADALQVRTKRAAEDVGVLERLWDDLRKTALQAWNAMADAGRMKTIDEQVREAEAALRGMETQSPEYEWWGSKKKLEDQRKLVEQLRAQRDAEHEAARAAAERQQVEAAGIQATGELIRLRERHASTEEKLSAALTDYRAKLAAIAKANPDSPLLDPKKVAADEKAIRESFERVTRSASGLRIATTGASAAAREAKKAADELLRKQAAMDGFIEDLIEKDRRAAEAALKALDDQARGLEEQIDLYGMTEAQIAAVTLQRAEERLEMARAGGVAPDYLAALEREVALRREIAGAAGTLEAKRANAEAAQAATREWERTAQEIEGAIYEAIVSGGEDAGEVLERTFKALVLRPIIQPIAQAAAGVVTNTLGFGGGSSSGSSSGFNIPGMGNMSMLSSGVQMLGGALGSSAIGSFGAGLGMTGAQVSGLAGAGLVNGGAAGLGSMVGAALPWVGAALGLASLFGLFDKKPSDKSAWATANPLTGALVDVGSMTGKKDPGQEARDATAQLAQYLSAFAQDAGINRNLTVMTGARDGFRVDLAGGLRTPTAPRGNGGYGYNFGAVGEDAMKRILNDLVDEGTLPQATIDAWRQMRTDAAGVARDAQEQMDVLDLLTRGINQAEIERANTMQQAGETLAAAYARMVAVEESIRAAISQAFDTPEEQLTAAFDALGVSIPATVDAYEALVRAQDLTTEAGRNQAVALLSVKDLWDEAQRAQVQAAEEALAAYARMVAVENAIRAAISETFDTPAERLAAAFKEMGQAIPQTLDEYEQLVRAQDLTTEGGRNLAEALLSVKDLWDEAQRAQVQAAEEALAVWARMVAVENAIRAAISETFDTPAERLAAAFKEMGQAIPQTLDEYEQLVRAQDLTTEGGRNLAEALLSVKDLWDEAQRAQVQAAEEAARAAEEALAVWARLRDDLTAFRADLTTGALAGLSPEAAYRAAQAQFAETSRFAGLGNQDALAQLADVGRALLEASRAYNAGTAAYYADRDTVLGAVDSGLALTGRKIAGFAGGGMFGGGLRIVGERGPELEATGAARIWNAQQTQAMLGGGAEVVRELQAVVRVLSTGLSSMDRRLANLERSSDEQARVARLAADRRAA